LREALRVLEQKGLIEIRTGVAGGSIVREVHSETLSENLGLLIRNRGVSLRDLAEFREGMEGGVAALAARRAKEQDLAELRSLLLMAEAHLAEGPAGWDAFVRCDEQIHMALATMSGNQLFITVMESLYRNIHSYYESYLPWGTALLEENFRDLQAIVAAVSGGDEESARQIAQGHVTRFNAYMEEKGNCPT
jgi:DNA-binding FadR family transcriptional regulator